LGKADCSGTASTVELTGINYCNGQSTSATALASEKIMVSGTTATTSEYATASCTGTATTTMVNVTGTCTMSPIVSTKSAVYTPTNKVLAITSFVDAGCTISSGTNFMEVGSDGSTCVGGGKYTLGSSLQFCVYTTQDCTGTAGQCGSISEGACNSAGTGGVQYNFGGGAMSTATLSVGALFAVIIAAVASL